MLFYRDNDSSRPEYIGHVVEIRSAPSRASAYMARIFLCESIVDNPWDGFYWEGENDKQFFLVCPD